MTAELHAREIAIKVISYLRKFFNVHVPTREILVIAWPYARLLARRPSVPQTYQCQITQSTGMATQMQLDFILAGNRIATGALWSRDN